mmetsp:Transcript_138621/g.196309  ORF Transcript_138621/g.196309 Transcript_138621/m.196309 type:complete len:94 (+) Transcript_138621:134-415(+)
MTKAARFGLVGFALVAMWAAVLTGAIPTSDTVVSIMPYAPFNLLCCFGSYSLLSIGYSLFTFGDADEAADELKKQVEEARRDLARHGIEVGGQ